MIIVFTAAETHSDTTEQSRIKEGLHAVCCAGRGRCPCHSALCYSRSASMQGLAADKVLLGTSLRAKACVSAVASGRAKERRG